MVSWVGYQKQRQLKKWTSSKWKTWALQRTMIKKMRRKPPAWEKILTNHLSDKRWELLELNGRDEYLNLKTGKELHRHFSKDSVRMIRKRGDTRRHQSLAKCSSKPQRDAVLHPPRWRSLKDRSAGTEIDAKQPEPSHTAGGKAKRCSLFGNRSGWSSNRAIRL